jgi:hypothetical protein
MATRTRSDVGRDTDEAPDYSAEELGERVAGLHDESKWGVLTTEFWMAVVVGAAVLIATAISDSLQDTRGWLLVTILAASYIVSRGIAKAGVGHLPVGAIRAALRVSGARGTAGSPR